VTTGALRFAARTVAPVTTLIKAGEIEASVARFAAGVLGTHARGQLPKDVRAHMRANTSTHVGQALADGGFDPITESQMASGTAPSLVIHRSQQRHTTDGRFAFEQASRNVLSVGLAKYGASDRCYRLQTEYHFAIAQV
jgi:hypothetical protein